MVGSWQYPYWLPWEGKEGSRVVETGGVCVPLGGSTEETIHRAAGLTKKKKKKKVTHETVPGRTTASRPPEQAAPPAWPLGALWRCHCKVSRPGPAFSGVFLPALRAVARPRQLEEGQAQGGLFACQRLHQPTLNHSSCTERLLLRRFIIFSEAAFEI